MADNIDIFGNKFQIIETKEKMTVPDCFKFKQNRWWSWRS